MTVPAKSYEADSPLNIGTVSVSACCVCDCFGFCAVAAAGISKLVAAATQTNMNVRNRCIVAYFGVVYYYGVDEIVCAAGFL